jgi:hypothetical protein
MRLFSHPLLGYAYSHPISKGLPKCSRNQKSLILGDLFTAYRFLPTAFWSPIAEVIPVSYCRQGSKHVYLAYCSLASGLLPPPVSLVHIISPSTMPPRRRSCLSCHISKQRCSREVPSCQSCVAQGKSESCVYEDTSSPNRDSLHPRRSKRRDQCKSALEGPQMQSQEPPNNGTTVLQDCGQPAIQHRDEEQAPPVHQASFVQGTKSLGLFTEERSFTGTYGKVNNALHPTANDCLPSTTLSENVLCQSKFCWTTAYFEMPLPVEFVLRYRCVGTQS